MPKKYIKPNLLPWSCDSNNVDTWMRYRQPAHPWEGLWPRGAKPPVGELAPAGEVDGFPWLVPFPYWLTTLKMLTPVERVVREDAERGDQAARAETEAQAARGCTPIPIPRQVVSWTVGRYDLGIATITGLEYVYKKLGLPGDKCCCDICGFGLDRTNILSATLEEAVKRLDRVTYSDDRIPRILCKDCLRDSGYGGTAELDGGSEVDGDEAIWFVRVKGREEDRRQIKGIATPQGKDVDRGEGLVMLARHLGLPLAEAEALIWGAYHWFNRGFAEEVKRVRAGARRPTGAALARLRRCWPLVAAPFWEAGCQGHVEADRPPAGPDGRRPELLRSRPGLFLRFAWLAQVFEKGGRRDPLLAAARAAGDPGMPEGACYKIRDRADPAAPDRLPRGLRDQLRAFRALVASLGPAV